ncbi:MAG: prepilin-type N-terminal cleavage/methylation domain-containing protein [Phycisphaerales bacterium]
MRLPPLPPLPPHVCPARSLAACTGRRRGFTLLETALTTVIIGVGVLALLESQQAFMRSNNWSTHSATGTYLANEIRELTRRLKRHDPVTGLWLQVQGGTSTVHGWGPDSGETVVTDFDDVDDFDGITFSAEGTTDPSDGDLPGPIDAFGQIIPEILADGTVLADENGRPLALQGWRQSVFVDKIDPYDTSVIRATGYQEPPVPPDFPGLAVDKFPLRVTVIVSYQGPNETAATEVAKVVWIVP